MSDLERQLREAVTERSHAFQPSPDLPGRIVTRVERRRRVRQLAAGAAVAAAAVAVVVAVSWSGGLASREGTQWSTDGRAPVSTVPGTGPATTSSGTPTTVSETTSSTTSSTSVTPTVPRDSAAVGPLTPLSRSGIGPVTAGMTLRAAQDAAGTTITPLDPTRNDCIDATLGGDGSEIMIVVEPPDAAGADPLDGVVRAVFGSVVPSEDGAMVGQSRAEIIATLGQPTSTIDVSSTYGAGGEVLLFEAGGFAYGAFVAADIVIGLQSGDPAWVDDPDGCMN